MTAIKSSTTFAHCKGSVKILLNTVSLACKDVKRTIHEHAITWNPNNSLQWLSRTERKLPRSERLSLPLDASLKHIDESIM